VTGITRSTDPTMAISIEEGVRHYISGRYTEAVEAFKQALRTRPDDGQIYRELGKSYFALGDYPRGIRALKKAVRINAYDVESLYWLGRIYLAQNKPKEAIKALKKCPELLPIHPAAAYVLGWAYKTEAQYQKAIDAYRLLLEEYPDRARPYLEISKVYYEMNLLEDAERWVKQAIERKPDYAEAHYWLGLVLGVRGDFYAAVRAYRAGHIAQSR
jgi:tetratricopeptide (TPR) repeat protein